MPANDDASTEHELPEQGAEGEGEADPESRALTDLSPELELLGPLGKGGAGEVFRARFRGREVALKLLHRSTPLALSRFVREAELAARVEHPGVARMIALGRCGDRPCLVSELAEGGSLADRWDELDSSVRLRLVREVAEACAAAHEAGVVHRDIKPDNILLDAEGRARLTDFGAAWTADLERLTRTGVIVGTPHCMAPEQTLGRAAEVGPPTDVWALGVLLYRALTDELPFLAESLLQQVVLIRTTAARPPSGLVPDLDPAWDEVCLRALATRPGERYPDAGAFLRALDAVGDSEPSARANSSLRSALAWAGGLLLGVGVALSVRPSLPLTPASPSPAASLSSQVQPTTSGLLAGELVRMPAERALVEATLKRHFETLATGDSDGHMRGWHPEHPRWAVIRRERLAAFAKTRFRISDLELHYLGREGDFAYARSAHTAAQLPPGHAPDAISLERWRYRQVWVLRRSGAGWRVWDNALLESKRLLSQD